ncbi:serine/threonine-protein phosphatase 6 regulatory ankyrin repeat subunit B-like [Stylophora pistillata]|uniref:serine/threonine-protein phosphatase 6 regulatory ankyrin repeat subunit B-like n=1 Tax=Stylophora pistillata TaxID=50429 RepID=UPI000C04BCBB|nr:serine/threonine-protein phosphatase 6 regulatory ankyrin repeat subunit B-like [Stylophora pistillata]
MLQSATRGGDTNVIDLILTHLPDIESKNAHGSTSLIIAVYHGKLQGVKYLLERGAKPLTKDNYGRDSLYHASSRDSDVLDILLSHVGSSESHLLLAVVNFTRETVSKQNARGRTPLMHAALNGNVQAVKGLIKRGADLSLKDKKGWNALHFAADAIDTDVIDLILTHMPNIESKAAAGSTPLIIAVRFAKMQSVKHLLERGANPLTGDNDGQDSLVHALSRDYDVLDLLLSHVAKSESTILFIGLWWGKYNHILSPGVARKK